MTYSPTDRQTELNIPVGGLGRADQNLAQCKFQRSKHSYKNETLILERGWGGNFQG